jgi:hypothetical protein
MKQIYFRNDYHLFKNELIPFNYIEEDDITREEPLIALNEYCIYDKSNLLKAMLILGSLFIALLLMNLTKV